MNILKSLSFTIPFLFFNITVDGWLFERKNVLPVLLGAVGAGVGISTTFNQQYLPMILWFTTATSPDINIKVSGAEGTLWDITGVGVNEFASIRQYVRTANYYLLEMGNSLVPWKTVTYTITNQTAAAFNVYGDSWTNLSEAKQRVNVAVSQQILASSGAEINNFTYLAMPSAGATDRYTITYRDGTSQSFDSRDELKAMLQFVQGSISAVAFSVDNNTGWIKKIQLFPAATQTVFIRKTAMAQDIQSTIIARQ